MDSVESHGTHQVKLDSSKPEEVKKFVADLTEAITKDMAEIRETELDQMGGFKSVLLQFKDEDLNGVDEVMVDRLGRIIVPHEDPWFSLTGAALKEGSAISPVVKKEPRYEGDKATALVIYLEAPKAEDKGGNGAEIPQKPAG